jgi:hypothetical protein
MKSKYDNRTHNTFTWVKFRGIGGVVTSSITITSWTLMWRGRSVNQSTNKCNNHSIEKYLVPLINHQINKPRVATIENGHTYKNQNQKIQQQ